MSGNHPVTVVTGAESGIGGEIARLFEITHQTFDQLDGVVANAGAGHAIGAFLDQDIATLEAVLTTNVMGTFLTIREAARRFVALNRRGSIVVTGSSTALRPVPGLLPYGVSKRAVHCMAKAAALELAPHHIRVNLLVLGTTATPLVRSLPGRVAAAVSETPMGEIVEPGELAKATAFLLSDDALHMTGTTIVIDAGRTI